MLIAPLVAVPLENDIIKDGRIVDVQRLAKRCYRGVVNCRSVITLCWRFRQSHITAVISTPVDVPR